MVWFWQNAMFHGTNEEIPTCHRVAKSVVTHVQE